MNAWSQFSIQTWLNPSGIGYRLLSPSRQPALAADQLIGSPVTCGWLEEHRASDPVTLRDQFSNEARWNYYRYRLDTDYCLLRSWQNHLSLFTAVLAEASVPRTSLSTPRSCYLFLNL